MTDPYKLWNQADIDYMRQIQNANFDDTMVIHRSAPAANGYGGTSMNWSDVASGVPCRIKVWARATGNTGSGEAHNWAHQEISMVDTYVTCPWDTDLQVNDEVTVTNHETGSQVRYQVLSLNQPTTVVTALKAKLALRRT